jgi:hypothetical protein
MQPFDMIHRLTRENEFIMRNISYLVMCCVLCAFISRAVGATIDSPEIEIPNSTTVATFLGSGELGTWRSRTQQVFDKIGISLIRRQYTVWDPQPSRNLDFVWVPDTLVGDRDGLVNGRGRLIWRLQGEPAYDPASVFAEYYGDLENGRADGHGTYFDKTGLRYVGAWRNGAMEGYGRLTFPSTDEYVGAFRAGKADGIGRYTDATGEIFDGTFVGGVREGGGTTKLVNGNSYRSNWVNGRETEESRAVRIAQIGGQSGAQSVNAITVPVAIEKQEDYDSQNEGATLWIRPNKRVLDPWKGDDNIQDANLGYGYGDGSVNCKFGVYNRSTRLQYITAAYLDIASSASDLQPAVRAVVGRRYGPCGASIYGPTVAFANFGWSAANNATLSLAFTLASQTAPAAGAPRISRRFGRIDKEFTLDLEPDLEAAGLNISFLKSRAQGTLCTSTNQNACIQQLKSSGIFGTLSNLVNSDCYQRREFVLKPAG